MCFLQKRLVNFFLLITTFHLSFPLAPSQLEKILALTKQLVSVDPKKVQKGVKPITAATPTTAATPPATPIAATSTNNAGVSTLTPPSTPIVASTNLSAEVTPMTIFTAVSALKGAIYSGQQGMAMSCSGYQVNSANAQPPLQFINVGLTGSGGVNWDGCEFDMTNPTLAQLAQQGVYVAVNQIAGTTNNIVQVCLTDQAGNIYAQAQQNISNSGTAGYMYANIGFNMHNTLSNNVPGAGQTYVNWVPIAKGQRVYYKQGATTATPIGGQTQPIVVSSPLVVNSGSIPSIPFSAINSLAGAVYSAQNNTPVSCYVSGKTGPQLQTVNVGLTDQAWTSWTSCTFTIFDDSIKDLYVAINMLQGVGSSGGNVVQVCLTDFAGNVYAQTILELTSNQGFVYANIGFNMSNTLATPGPGQTYVNGFPISSGQRIWYKQGTSTTTAIGGTAAATSTNNAAVTSPTTPTTAVTPITSSTLTPPATPIAATSPLQVVTGSIASIPFVPINALTGAVYSAQNNTAISCYVPGQTGSQLQTINVGLTDQAISGWTSCTFTITEILQQLAQQGLYVAVNMISAASASGSNTVQVCLTDIAGNVYAQTSMSLTNNQGFVYVNIGFNMSNTLVTPAAGSTYVNWVPIALGQRVWYKQGTAQNPLPGAGIGGPSAPPIQLVNNQSLLGKGSPLAFVGSSYNPNQSFSVTSANPTMNGIVTAQNGQPLSCSTALTTVKVDLTDQNNNVGASATFDMTSTAMQTLANNGFFVAVYLMQVAGASGQANNNIVNVSLVDQNQNIQQSTSLADLNSMQGFSYTNVTFNPGTTGSAKISGINISTGQCAYYKQAVT